ncbi:MAG: DUF4398 domain-containing protein [Bdellovibrionales bacterium]|nr:DUF4398 domain-containing protein [Bdellovibrionales bacterium]
MIIGLFNLTLGACVGPAPLEDYTLAYTSLEAARAARASKFAPGYLNQAEDYYRQALVDFEDRRYKEARDNFTRARKFAEKAENYTVLKKAETGESE